MRAVRARTTSVQNHDGTSMSTELADLVLEETTEQMKEGVAHARTDFAKIRTGRANPALVEKLMVDYYGTDVPAAADRRVHRARGPPAAHHALRQELGGCHREGHPELRSRASRPATTASPSACPSRPSPRSAARSSCKQVRKQAEEAKIIAAQPPPGGPSRARGAREGPRHHRPTSSSATRSTSTR